MPYKTNADLPEAVRGALPSGAQDIWRGAFNGSAESGGDEEASARIAWSAVKRKYEKRGDEWVLKVDDADYDAEQRRAMAKSGEAMPDGSYPIRNRADLENAIHAVGRGSDNSHLAIRRHVIKRARALGETSALPESWNVQDSSQELHFVDSFVLADGLRKTTDGYLAADARVARTGIQIYRGSELGRPELDKVRVYRPPEEVFSRDAMHSMAHRPVTLSHPPVMVDAANWRKYAVGQTGGDVVRDGDCVRVPMVVMDHDAVGAYDSGVRELSMGYTADIEWTPGVTDAGEQYDAVQSGIRANHLAIVPFARGGSKLRMGDGHRRKGENRMPKILTIDNAPIEFSDEISAAHVQNHITKLNGLAQDLQGKLDQSEASRKTAAEAAEKNVADATAKIADAQKQLEAKDGEIAGLKKKLEDAESKYSPESLDALVKSRADVIDRAATLVDQAYDFAGKSIEDIRRAAVSKKLGDSAVRDMSDSAVEGAFAALTANHTPRTGVSVLRDALSVHRPHSVTSQDVRDAALSERNKNLTEAWRTPATRN